MQITMLGAISWIASPHFQYHFHSIRFDLTGTPPPLGREFMNPSPCLLRIMGSAHVRTLPIPETKRLVEMLDRT